MLSHGCCSVLKQLVSCFPALIGQEGRHCCVHHSAGHPEPPHLLALLLLSPGEQHVHRVGKSAVLLCSERATSRRALLQ